MAATLFDAKGDLLTASADDTPARLAVGSNGQVLTADSAQTLGIKWATPSSGSSAIGFTTAAMRVGATENRFYVAAYNPVGISALGPFTALAVGRLYAMPFIPPRNTTIDRLAFEISSTAAVNARIGLYTDDGNLYPATRLADSGDISCNTAGLKTYTLTQALTAGTLYWAAIECASAVPTFRCCDRALMSPILGWPSNFTISLPTFGWGGAHTYGTLPTPFPASAAELTAAPIPAMGLRGT
jgi:hypothetical protein